MKKASRLSGMTLIELLVAFIVLLMLVGALVTLTTRSLETWTQGEARKDMYDRAAVVLDLIASDLRNMYAETELFNIQKQPLVPPSLACDPDKNGRQRIRFVRTGNPAVMRAAPGVPPVITAPTYYTPTWEVAYVMDPKAEKNLLYRGLRGFDRRKSGTLLNPLEYSSEGDEFFANHTLAPVETGVLFVGFRFWTQFTSTWDENAPIQRNSGSVARKPSGPEKRWDSTRRIDRNFYFYRNSQDLTNPDFVYPESIQVTVTIESAPPELHGVKVVEAIDDRSNYLRVSHTRGMADVGMVKIEGEWIEYQEKSFSELMRLRRGQRGTKPVAHALGTPVSFGETFTTEVKLPVAREAQEP